MSQTVFTWALLVLYAAAAMWISLRTSKISDTKVGYFQGGQSMGVLAASCSMVMGFLSGMVIVGFPAFGLRMSSAFYLTAGFGFMGLIYPMYGYRLWRYGKKYGYITTSNYIADRYESESFSKIYSAIQLVFMVPYIAVQYVAFGNAMEACAGIPYLVGMIILAVLIMISLFFGGAKGAGMLDILNAALGVGVPIALFVCLLVHFKMPLSQLGTAVEAVDAGFNTTNASADYFPQLFKNFQTAATGHLFLLFGPHVVSKMFMLPSKQKFNQMVRRVPMFYMVVCLPLQCLTLAGIAFYAHLRAEGRTDGLLFEMLSDVGSPILTALMAVCILAFCISTCNSFAVACAGIISQDFYEPMMRRRGVDMDTPENVKKAVNMGKFGVLIVTVVGIIFGISRSVYITDYVYSLASPGFAQVLPALLLGLYWRRGGKAAGISSFLVGNIVVVITMFFWKTPFGITGITPAMWGLACNLIVYLIVAFCTKPSQKVYEKFFADEDRYLIMKKKAKAE